MHNAVHSSIGLCSMPTNASWMLALFTPAEVSKYRIEKTYREPLTFKSTGRFTLHR
jgi:hypothetical protein